MSEVSPEATPKDKELTEQTYSGKRKIRKNTQNLRKQKKIEKMVDNVLH